MRRWLVILGLGLALVASPPAGAHAEYYASEPPRGARLDAAPTEVVVTLSEAIDPAGSGLDVTDAEGNRVDEGETRIENGATPILRASLKPGLGAGAYRVSWHALSTVDGHITSGTFGFAVGEFEPPTSTQGGTDYDPASATSRAISYTGYALGFGATAFLLAVEPRETFVGRERILRRVAFTGGLVLAVGISALTIVTSNRLGEGFSGFVDTQVGRQFVARTLVAWATAIMGLVVLLARSQPPVLMFGLCLLLDAVGNSLFVHSSAEGFNAIANDFVHLVSVSVWLGALLIFVHFLVQAGRSGTYDDVMRIGRRFSRLAFVSVMLLGVTGLVSSFLILGVGFLAQPWALIQHPYGRLLLAKILLFGGMLAIAGVNRCLFLRKHSGTSGPVEHPGLFTRWFSAEPTKRIRYFRRFAGTEAALGLVTLCLAGFLTSISPPSVEAFAPEAPFTASGQGQEFNAVLFLEPDPRSGHASQVSVRLTAADSGAAVTEAIRVRVTIAAANATGGESWTATHLGAGRWNVGEILFTQAGDHHAMIDIQTEEVYRDTIHVAFTIA